MLTGALLLALYSGYSFGSHGNLDSVQKRLGLKPYEYKTALVIQGIGTVLEHEKDLARAIYELYDDGPEKWFANSMESPGWFPSYSENHNTKLVLLYNWLMSLGYEMSTEETAMFDGSHEVYRSEEAFENEKL